MIINDEVGLENLELISPSISILIVIPAFKVSKFMSYILMVLSLPASNLHLRKPSEFESDQHFSLDGSNVSSLGQVMSIIDFAGSLCTLLNLILIIVASNATFGS